jgi:hypothetical protein
VSYHAVLAVMVIGGAIALGVYLWIKLLNSESGERYLKQRMQGPFVPTEKDKK